MQRRMRIRSLMLVVVFMLSFCLQGCSIKEAETTYNISADSTRKKVTIEMKADKSQGYQWKFYTQNNALIKSSVDLDRDDVFSETRITKCTFTAEEAGITDTIYMVLIKDGDIDSAKAYAYPVSYDEDIRVTVGAVSEYTVGLNGDIKARVTELQ